MNWPEEQGTIIVQTSEPNPGFRVPEWFGEQLPAVRSPPGRYARSLRRIDGDVYGIGEYLRLWFPLPEEF